MTSANLKYCFLIIVLSCLWGCNLTKLVPEGDKLLVKTKIEHQDKSNVDFSDESGYIKQRPNRKLFGFVKFHLWAYQYGSKGLGGDTGAIRRFLLKNGEPPVILDTALADASARRLSDYYYSKGYLSNSVTYEIKNKKILKKRAKVIYSVELGKFHRIASVEYLAESKQINDLLMKNIAKSRLIPGNRLDFENITAERTRLATLLKNNGFYFFNNTFIDFKVDTVQTPGYAHIRVYIRNDRDYKPHEQQKIRTVVVQVGTDLRKDTLVVDGIQLIQGNYFLKSDFLVKNIHFRPGELYRADKVQQTYSDLLSSGIFRFVTIRFKPSGVDSLNVLDAEIILQTASRHDFIWEPQAIMTEQGGGIEAAQERNFGIGNNFTLNNRNVFGGGETFSLNASTSLETQFKRDGNRLFTNFRQSLSSEFAWPGMLFFDDSEFGSDFFNKTTKLTASYLYDRNVNYTRHVLPLNFSYGFGYKHTSFSVTPLRISYNRAFVEPSFLDGLSEDAKQYINQLLTDNLIMGSVLSLYWTDRYKSPKKYWTVRTNPLEMSGNLFSAYYAAFTQLDEINKQILGVKYSQYYRADADITYNHIIDENNALVYRLYGGIGIPYGNTRFLPFERRFFVGGANSLRAWRPRTIGPGGYSDQPGQISIDKTGEIMLQGNAEYRFDITDNFLGAWFVDGGNIWNFRKDENFENAEFNIKRFYKEIAINSGIGVRYDFSYLIFRIDWGVAMRDPSYPEGDRWVILDFPSPGWIGNNSALIFAVGYPF